MRAYKKIIYSIFTLLLILPGTIFAAPFTIDPTAHTSRLCDNIPNNTDCHSYTLVNWLVDPSLYSTPPTPVEVSDTAITGLIWSEKLGWIKLDPDSPAPVDPREGVKNNTSGEVSGFAWGGEASWINFRPTNGDLASVGGVIINSDGEFDGWAWVSSVGWMNFDCRLVDGLGNHDACVKTDWRPTTLGGSGGGSGSGTSGTTTGHGGHTTTGGATTGVGSTTGGHTSTTGGGATGGGTTGHHGGTTGAGTTAGGTTGVGTTNGGDIITTTTGGGGGDPCALGNSTDIFGNILDQTRQSFCNTQKKVKETVKNVKDVINTPLGDTVTKTIATTGIIAGATSSIVSALFLNPLSFSEIFLLPVRLWALFLAAMGLKKRRRPWGTVYDSITKQPLDPVHVSLRNIEGAEVAESITDLDGRYGFVVTEPGTYTLTVNKANYFFPSQKLVGRDHDELYRDLYFGEHFTVANAGDIVFKNIPMDPEKFDWNEFQKGRKHLMSFYSNRQKVLRIFSDALFGLCFVVTSVAVIVAPKTYNIATFLLYVMLYFVRMHGTSSRPYGYVVEEETGYPISFAIMRITNDLGVEIMHRITDATGRYYALLSNGTYHVRIDRKVPDGSYKTILENRIVVVTKGYLADKFLVPVQGPDIQIKPKAPESLIRHYEAQDPTANSNSTLGNKDETPH